MNCKTDLIESVLNFKQGETERKDVVNHCLFLY